MMSEYTIAWLIYGAGALALLVALWRTLRGLGREWRHLILVSAAVWLLTPGPMDVEGAVFLAPALFVLVLDSWFESFAQATPAGLILLGVWLVALLLSLLYQLWRRPARQPDRSQTG